MDATIAAIATAHGEAALAIVRVSGPAAVSISDAVFKGRVKLAESPARSAQFGRAMDGDGRTLDEVVATVFRAPASATGQDVVEITCHGGQTAPVSILKALYVAGAHPAEPGEFTQRAFLNGKLDLAQAEAVMDLIHSRSVAAQRVAVRQLRGHLKETLARMRGALLELVGLLELELDFSEEDVEFADRPVLHGLLEEVSSLVGGLLRSASMTGQIRDGVRVVIAGRPNAGKSTLLNAMLGDDRVIVSTTPGTTRDAVEAETHLDGLLVRLVDTAGRRQASDEIEQEGVRRAELEVQRGDVVLYVFDASSGPLGPEEEQYVSEVAGRGGRVVLVGNKTDVGTMGLKPSVVGISALQARGRPVLLDPLRQAILDALPEGLRDYEAADGMVNARHRAHLERCQVALERARRTIALGSGGELVTVDLRTALHELGCITGEVTTEDVLGEIFGRFCIGK